MNRTNHVFWVLLEDHFVDITEMIDIASELGYCLWWGKPPPYNSALILRLPPSAEFTPSSSSGQALSVAERAQGFG